MTRNMLTLIAFAFYMAVLASCNAEITEKESLAKPTENAAAQREIESIPDSVIQFLTTSAATDFNTHQPPTAIDIREVKAGYIASDKEKIYLICGEYFSKEKNNWESFTTIKTSGYEQYLGHSSYCDDATFVSMDAKKLSEQLKNKLAAVKK